MPIVIKEEDNAYTLDMTYETLQKIIARYEHERERLRVKSLRQYYARKPKNYEKYGKCKKPKNLKIESEDSLPADSELPPGVESDSELPPGVEPA